jgi:hypothetical protein
MAHAGLDDVTGQHRHYVHRLVAVQTGLLKNLVLILALFLN